MYYETDFSIVNKLISDFKKDLKEPDDINVYVFPQGWGSTALGYGGIGGSAMTSAHTIILHAQYLHVVRIYFGGSRLAYEIASPNDLFFKDLHAGRLEGCNKAEKYRRKD